MTTHRNNASPTISARFERSPVALRALRVALISVVELVLIPPTRSGMIA